MNIKTFLLLVLCIALLSCEDDNLVAITNNAVYAEFFVKYERAIDATTGTAIFWEGNRSKRIIFHGDAKLLFNNYTMEYADFTYYKGLQGFHSPSTFAITDVNKKTFTNSISFNSIDFPAINLDTIDSAQPLTLFWFGNPLQSGETVSLRIGNVSAQEDSVGSRSVTFTTAQFSELSSLKNSSVTVVLERLKTVQPLPEPLGGGLGFISGQYIAVPRTVYLK